MRRIPHFMSSHFNISHYCWVRYAIKRSRHTTKLQKKKQTYGKQQIKHRQWPHKNKIKLLMTNPICVYLHFIHSSILQKDSIRSKNRRQKKKHRIHSFKNTFVFIFIFVVVVAAAKMPMTHK